LQKTLNNFQKIRKNTERQKHRENIEKIVKGHIVSIISSEHMFNIHKELKQYGDKIEAIKLEGKQLFPYNISLHVVEKWLRSEINRIDFVNLDAKAHNSPLPWENSQKRN